MGIISMDFIRSVYDTDEKAAQKIKENQAKWDKRYLAMAEFVSTWSKDPSTKCGAVLVRPDKTVISLGYNGFAAEVDDSKERYENRDIKYEMVIHCEINALIAAHGSVEGSTLYTYPFQSCSRCAAVMIQAGIKRHVAPKASEDVLSRWKDSIALCNAQMSEAGVEVVLYDMELV